MAHHVQCARDNVAVLRACKMHHGICLYAQEHVNMLDVHLYTGAPASVLASLLILLAKLGAG